MKEILGKECFQATKGAVPFVMHSACCYTTLHNTTAVQILEVFGCDMILNVKRETYWEFSEQEQKHQGITMKRQIKQKAFVA
jgi:hypothetical protein